MFGTGSNRRTDALAHEIALIRQELTDQGGRHAVAQAARAAAEERQAEELARIRAELAAMAQRLSRQDQAIAKISTEVADAVLALDGLVGHQAGQRRRLDRVAAVHRGQAKRARGTRERIATAEVALRRLANRVDLEAQQCATAITAVLERIEARAARKGST